MNFLSTSLIALILICISNASYGQTEKGDILLGAQSSLDFKTSSLIWNDHNTQHDLNFSLSPRAGIFILDNLAVGLSLPMGINSHINKNDEYEAISRFISAGPFVRKYFGSHEIIRPYINGEAGYGFMKNIVDYYEGNTEEENTRLLSYAIGGGISIFISQKVALDLGLSFDYLSIKEDDYNQTNFRNITSDLNFEAGVVVIL